MRRLLVRLAMVLTLAWVWSDTAMAEDHGKPPEKGADAHEEAKKPEKGGETKGDKDDKGVAAVSLGMYYQVPELMANLSTSAKKPVYLKMTISLQMAKESDRAQLDIRVPLLIDGFQNYLRELSAEDLSGSMGIYRLREELLIRASTIALPIEIKDVLFKEVLVR